MASIQNSSMIKISSVGMGNLGCERDNNYVYPNVWLQFLPNIPIITANTNTSQKTTKTAVANE